MLVQNENCYVDEEEIVNYLEHVIKVDTHTQLYIGAGLDEDQLPLLCSTYHCFNREDVWQPQTSLIPHAEEQFVMSYVDFLIIQLAKLFIGNRFSNFSMELFHHFRNGGKFAAFVNELQCQSGERITYVGCEPQTFLDCCV